MSRVQQEVVGLVALACALEDSAGDKGPGCGRFSREMAANFLESASHGRYGCRVKFLHFYSLNFGDSYLALDYVGWSTKGAF